MKKIFLLLIIIASLNSPAQELTASWDLPTEIKPLATYVINVTINKGSLSGFIKFNQSLPIGITAEDINSNGASFTVNDEGIRIIWTQPPNGNELKITYKIIASSVIEGNSFTGKISYIDGNERKIFEFPNVNFTISGANAKSFAKQDRVKENEDNFNEKKEEKVAKKEKASKTEKEIVEEDKNEKATKKEKTSVEEVKDVEKEDEIEEVEEIKEVVVKKTEPIKPVVQNTTAPTSAITTSKKTYKVQIGAFGSTPNINGVSEISTLKLDNGITKYFSGNFSTYEEAIKRKNQVIEKGFKGAFIVSFEDGKISK